MTLREMVDALEGDLLGLDWFRVHAHSQYRSAQLDSGAGGASQRAQGHDTEQKTKALRWLFEAEIFEQFVREAIFG